LPFGQKKLGNFGFKKCKLGEFAVLWLNFAKLPISQNWGKKLFLEIISLKCQNLRDL
jgi:hypothetical protein